MITVICLVKKFNLPYVTLHQTFVFVRSSSAFLFLFLSTQIAASTSLLHLLFRVRVCMLPCMNGLVRNVAEMYPQRLKARERSRWNFALVERFSMSVSLDQIAQQTFLRFRNCYSYKISKIPSIRDNVSLQSLVDNPEAISVENDNVTRKANLQRPS